MSPATDDKRENNVRDPGADTPALRGRRLVVRFDIDSLQDLTDGVPRLLPLLHEIGVRAVFFVNMGRLVSRSELLMRSPGRTWSNLRPSGSVKLGLLSKFGWIGALRTLLLNPLIGAAHTDLVSRIPATGHELGLHGGMNHTVWQRRGAGMSEHEIERLARPALQAFKLAFGQPSGFASPGFVTSDAVRAWVSRNGFAYSMDSSGEDALLDLRRRPPDFPVTLIGPGAVPFIEYQDARGTPPAKQRAIFRAALNSRKYAALYGHPMYEGLRRGDLFASLISEARAAGFEVATPGDLLNEVEQ